MLLFICITIFFVLSIIAVSVNMNVMTFYTDRYVFYVMPWAAIAFVLIGKYIFSIITPIFKYYKYALSVLCCAALISSNMNCTLKYFFLNDIRGAGGIASTVNENSRYIMLLEDSWLLTVYPYKLMNCNSFFPVIVADSTITKYFAIFDIPNFHYCYYAHFWFCAVIVNHYTPYHPSLQAKVFL